MFQVWSKWRQEICLVDNVLLVHESEIDKMPQFYLNEVLSQFIAEVRKEREESYPGKTFHEST